MTISLYAACNTANNLLRGATQSMDTDELFNLPAHIQPLDTEARRLNDQLAERFAPFLQQYDDGLISAFDLFNFMADESSRPAE